MTERIALAIVVSAQDPAGSAAVLIMARCIALAIVGSAQDPAGSPAVLIMARLMAPWDVFKAEREPCWDADAWEAAVAAENMEDPTELLPSQWDDRSALMAAAEAESSFAMVVLRKLLSLEMRRSPCTDGRQSG